MDAEEQAGHCWVRDSHHDSTNPKAAREPRVTGGCRPGGQRLHHHRHRHHHHHHHHHHLRDPLPCSLHRQKAEALRGGW